MEFVTPTMSYDLACKGQSYRVLEYGRDYTQIVARGRPFYVPNCVFDPANLSFQEELNTEENIE